MTKEIDEKAESKNLMDRRSAITTAAAAAAGVLGAMAAPTIAAAATGDVVNVGQLREATGTDPGVWATSPGGDGVVGWSGGVNKSGVWGSNTDGDGGAGVTGDGKIAGVVGRGGATGDGIKGYSTAPAASLKSGVYGENLNWAGVSGVGKHGVGGLGGAAGFGVWAVQGNPTGWALGVTGKAWFNRSGVASIGKAKSSVTVTLADVAGKVDAASLFIATPQSSLGGGCYVAYVSRTSDSTFKIQLSKKTTKAGKIAWFVLDAPSA